MQIRFHSTIVFVFSAFLLAVVGVWAGSDRVPDSEVAGKEIAIEQTDKRIDIDTRSTDKDISPTHKKEFIPTEKIPAGTEVAFPADI